MLRDKDQARALDDKDRIRSHIPVRLWEASWVKVDPEAKHHKPLSKFLDQLDDMLSRGIGLYLWGDYSVGKSSCAAIIAKQVIARGGTALFVSADDLKDLYINETPFDEDYTMVERLLRVDLLIIDNVGEEPDREYSGSRIVRIVRARVDDRKMTIITTNLKKADVQARYGDKLLEVMCGSMMPVEMRGKNWRRDMGVKLTEWFEHE